MGEIHFSVVSRCEEVTPKDVKGEKKGQPYFKLSVKTGRGYYLIAASSIAEKMSWMNAFNSAIDEYKKNQEKWEAIEKGDFDVFSNKQEIQRKATLATALERPRKSSVPPLVGGGSMSASGLIPISPRTAKGQRSPKPVQQDGTALSDADQTSAPTTPRGGDDDTALFDEDLYKELLEETTDTAVYMRAKQLYAAVKEQRYPAIQALIGLNSPVSWQNDEEGNKNSLHLAAELGDVRALKMLLHEVSTPLHVIRDSLGWTPLHYAAFQGHLNCIEAIVEHHDNNDDTTLEVSPLDEEDRTPAYLALLRGHIACCYYLAQASSERDGDASRWSALHMSALCDNPRLASIQALLPPEQQTNASIESVVELGDFGVSMLHISAATGNVELTKYLLERKDLAAQSSADVLDNGSKTPLHFACCAGSVQTLDVLLQQGSANVFAHDNRNKSPLHFAAGSGHIECVRRLLDVIGAHPDKESAAQALEDEYGFTPLHNAAMHGHLDVVALLLSSPLLLKKINNRATYLGLSPLFLATHSGHVDVVGYLVEQGANANLANNKNQIPLHEAASEGHADCVEKLLVLGADVNAKDKQGFRPLHYAAANESLESVQCLLEHDAELSAKTDSSGESALSIAVNSDHEHIVRELIDAGADLDEIINGQTLLHLACASSFAKVVRCLVDRGHEMDILDDSGRNSPLMIAIRTQSLSICKYLVSNGASVDFASRTGWLPIHEAACLDNVQFLQLFLSSEESKRLSTHAAQSSDALTVASVINNTDKFGVSPLHVAAKYGRLHIVQFLIANGADPTLADQSGNCPIHFAAEAQHNEVVLTLSVAQVARSSPFSTKAQKHLDAFFQQLGTEYAPLDSNQHMMASEKTTKKRSSSKSKKSSSSKRRGTRSKRSKKKSSSTTTSGSSSGGGGGASSSQQEKPAPFVRTESMQMSAKQYIQTAQKVLTEDQYMYFQKLLRDFKSQKLKIHELMEKIKALFEGQEKRKLLTDFVQFIPSKHKQTFKNLCMEQ